MDKELSDGEYKLIGAIVQQAVIDYCVESKNKKSSSYKEMDKNSAELFFTKSRLFKLTGLDWHYLVNEYKKGSIKSHRDVEDENE